MDRLECFNVAAAYVLQRLLEVFPEPVVLDAEAILKEIGTIHPECEVRGGPGNPGHNLVSWTVHYLIDEGFVRCTDSRGLTFVRCTLTSKALTALNQPLEALDPKPSVGRRLLEVGKLFGPEVAGAIITRLLAR